MSVLIILNFVIILIVISALVYQYYLFFDTKQKTEEAIAQGRVAIATVNDNLTTTSATLTDNLNTTSATLTKNLNTTKTALTDDLTTTKTALTDDITNTKTELTNNITNTKTALTDDLTNTKTALTNDITDTKTSLTDDLTKTKTSLTNSTTTLRNDMQRTTGAISSVLNDQFKTLSNQLTTNNVKSGKYQLGDKWTLSGVGDTQGNDDWLRLMGKDGKDYYGGVAMGKIWTRDNAYLNGAVDVNGNLNLKGGTSEHNPSKWQTFFPYAGDNKNYIRGDTELRGNTNNIGDVSVGRDLDLKGTLWFGKNDGSTDPYSLRKVIAGPNKSSLRLTINDDADEALEIWGNSCASKGGCTGEGVLQHKFTSTGDVVHQGDVLMTGGKSIKSSGRMHIAGDEQLYLLNKNGVTIGKEWGGSGDLRVQGNVGIDGTMKGKTMCIEDVCVTKDQLTKMLKQAGA